MRSKSTTARFQLYDHVYYWPMYLNITHQVAYDDSAVAVFSLSKMAGLASSRVGWVITSNTQVAAFIRRWSMITHISQPIQSHMIAALSIEHIISSGGLIFEEMRAILHSRCSELLAAVSASKSWLVSTNLLSSTTGLLSSPPYAWLRNTVSANAEEILMKAQIKVSPGRGYGMTDSSYVRISMVVPTRDFDLFLHKFKASFAS